MCVYAMAMFTNDIPGGAIHKLSERCNRVLSLSLLCSALYYMVQMWNKQRSMSIQHTGVCGRATRSNCMKYCPIHVLRNEHVKFIIPL